MRRRIHLQAINDDGAPTGFTVCHWRVHSRMVAAGLALFQTWPVLNERCKHCVRAAGRIV